MAIKKSDLYSSLWASCDELRGGMDASQYKDYVLFMLFIKYVSDKYGDSDDFASCTTSRLPTSCRATRWPRPNSRMASRCVPMTTSSPIRRFQIRRGAPA